MSEEVQGLIDEMKKAKEVKVERKVVSEDIEKMRGELIEQSKKGTIKDSVAKIEGMSDNLIRKNYEVLQANKKRKTSNFLADFSINMITKFLYVGGYIGSAEDLSKDLKDDDIFMGELREVSSDYVGYIPYVGLASGIYTIVCSVYDHTQKPEENVE